MSKSKPERVLVTGATGLLGSHAVRALLGAGHAVRAFVRSPEKANQVFAGRNGMLEIARGDIADVGSVRTALDGCDGLLHCAAAVAAGSAQDSRRLIETNVAGVRNVVGTAVDLGLQRIVHVSSIAPLFRSDGSPITEESEPQPSKRAYSQSKMLAESYVRELQAAGDPVKIIYPGAILGPDDPGLVESNASLTVFMRKMLPITTGGIQYVDVRDLAVALVRILEDEPGPARYLAPGTFVSWTDLAQILEKVTGEKPATKRVNPVLLRFMGQVFDLLRKVVPVEFPLSVESATYVTKWHPIPSSKALAQLGVEFRSLEETLRDTTRWLYEMGHL